MADAPTTSRLKSRKPFYKSDIDGFDPREAWEKEWRENIPPGGAIVDRIGQKLPGFKEGSRKQWVTTNRLRAKTGRTAANMNRWHLNDSPTCPHCKQSPQDTDHLILDCPITKLNGGYESVHSFNDDYKRWLDELMLEV